MTLDELLAMDEIEDLSEWRNSVSQGVADLSAGMQARLSELEEKLTEAERRYQETAARNYELMIAATAPAEGEGEEPEESREEIAEKSIDALFEGKEN
nr:MAG TPA: hypothetical protein [Caudoviricetes sp.]